MIRIRVRAAVLVLLLLSLTREAAAACDNGFFAFSGAGQTLANYPFANWPFGLDQLQYYFDSVLPRLNVRSVRFFLPANAVDEYSSPELGARLVAVCDTLVQSDMTALIHIVVNKLTSEPDLDLAKEQVDRTVGYLSQERQGCRGVLGWVVDWNSGPGVSADTAEADRMRRLLRHVRLVDGMHPVGTEFEEMFALSSDAFGFQINGLRHVGNQRTGCTLCDQSIVAHDVYDDIDFISYSTYYLRDGSDPYITGWDGAESVARINMQNPDNKPIIIEEFGTLLNDDIRGTFNMELMSRDFLRGMRADGTCGANVLGTYVWSSHVDDPEGFSAFWPDPATPSPPYQAGVAKKWARVFEAQTERQPFAAFSFEDRYSATESWDYSGSGHALTLHNGAANYWYGHSGHGLYLSAYNSAYGTFSGPDVNHLFFKAWIMPYLITGGDMNLISNEGPNSLGAVSIFLDSGGHLSVWADVGAGWRFQASTPEVVPPDRWTKVAVSYDGLVWRLYLNDDEKTKAVTRGRIADTSTRPWYIGSWRGQAAFGFTGVIDEVIVAKERPYLAGWSFDGTNLQDYTPASGLDWTFTNTGFSPHGPQSEARPRPALTFNGVNSTAVLNSATNGDTMMADFYFLTWGMDSSHRVLASAGSGERGNSWGSGWSIFVSDSRVHFVVNLDSSSSNGPEIHLVNPAGILCSLWGDPPTEVWYHVRAEYDGYTARLLVDAEEATIAAPGWSPRAIAYPAGAPSLTLGQYALGRSSNNYLDGIVDELKIDVGGL